MPSANNTCQAVFLIDTHSDHADDVDGVRDEYCKQISLSVFRILSYLLSENPYNLKQKSLKFTTLKWGYKFFDSKSHRLRVEKYIFKEFKLKYFEEFEREIQKRTHSLNKNNHKNNSNHSKTPKKNNKISSCDCLNRTLTELIDDFVWETPDLFSPIKKSKVHQTTKDSKFISKNCSGNYVFIFSKCPKSASCLRQFAKKKVLDSSVFIDSFMPASLFTKLSEELKLKLYWIDTDRGSLDVIPDLESLTLVENALERVNGKVIPIEAIVHDGKQQFSCPVILGIDQNDTDKEEEKRKKNQSSGSIIPFTSIFEYYLLQDKRCLPHHTGECILQYKDMTICKLEVTSSHRINKTTSSQSSAAIISIPSVEKDVTVCYDNSDILNHMSVLEVYCITQQLSLHTNDREMFICVGIEPVTQTRSLRFQELMCHMIKRQIYLIVLSKDLSTFFLLKPLTTTSAALSVVSTKVILDIEKQLMISADQTFNTDEPSTEPTARNWQGLLSQLCTNKLPKTKHLPQTGGKKISPGGIFNPTCVDKTHLPGCQAPFISLIDKLNERISQLEFLSDSEVKTLRQLQKMYHVESRPPKLIDHTPQTKQHSFTENVSEENISLTEDITLKDDKRRDSVQSRGQMIVTRSKQAVKEKEPDKSVEEAKTKPVTTGPVNVDFKDEDELKAYLYDMYEKSINNDTSYLFSSVQPLVCIVLHFMRESGKDNPQESCEQLLKSSIILSAENLRLKHQTDFDKQLKIREYQLQIMLRLEMQSVLNGGDPNMSVFDDKVEEIVTLLRTISFITEPKLLSEFMKNCLVENFLHSLPQMLGSIYDELMQPYPPELESVLSPDESAGDASVFNQSLQSCVDDMPQPKSAVSDVLTSRPERSTRSRRLVHHPSLVDFGPKRQIVVVTTKNRKDKEQKKDDRRKKKEKDREKRKLERRQSVAVMETVKTSVKKKVANMMKSPKNMKSPTRRLVSETPAHKQKKHNMWKRLEKERRRTQSIIDVKVVAESPVKSDLVEIDSPSQKKRALAMLRRSFYSAGPVSRSRSLTNSLELADRIAGRKSHYAQKTKRESLFDLKSPDRNSSFLFSQLMGSPDSARKSPGKKFSLCQQLQSPSQNTRSKTPSKLLSSQKFPFQEKSPKRSIKKLSFTPVKNSENQGVVIPDSPCLNTRSHTPQKNLSRNTHSGSPAINLFSPSQSTRSKVACTPTRHSVKAKLFMKSPEQKLSSSLLKPASLDVPLKGKRTLNLNENYVSFADRELHLTNQNQVTGLSVINGEVVSEKQGEQTERTPSPNKLSVTMTPNSLDTWPRKKKWTKIKYGDSQSIKESTSENKRKVEDEQSSVSSSEDDEISVMIHDNIDVDERLQPNSSDGNTDTISEEILLQKPPMTLKRGLTLSPDGKLYETPSKRRCFSLSQDSQFGTGINGNLKRKTEISSGQQDNIDLKVSRKRNLNMSPENIAFSQNKRQKVSSNTALESTTFSQQSFIQGKNMSTNEGSSQGFDVQSSQRSSQGFNVQSSQRSDILSVASSEDYFSALNNEVFLSPSRLSSSANQLNNHSCEIESPKLKDFSHISNIRSASPVFGSSKKHKCQVQSETTSQQQTGEKSILALLSPCAKVLVSDDAKVSPSTKKYSPSVSAKSLCHLISSPILNSTRENHSDSSPKLDKDSLNIRRQKMPDRIRRSLIQN